MDSVIMVNIGGVGINMQHMSKKVAALSMRNFVYNLVDSYWYSWYSNYGGILSNLVAKEGKR
jgi:hypothetical protein